MYECLMNDVCAEIDTVYTFSYLSINFLFTSTICDYVTNSVEAIPGPTFSLQEQGAPRQRPAAAVES